MSEIRFTLPTVRYGNAKIAATPEELGLKDIADGYSLGVAVAVYLNRFSQGFQKGASLDLSDAPPGDVKAPGTYWEATQEQHAQELLNEGLGGVTELPSEADIQAAESVIGSDAPDDVQNAAYALLDQAKTPDYKVGDTVTVGGIEFTKHSEAPWEQPSKAAGKKPWETSSEDW